MIAVLLVAREDGRQLDAAATETD
eukprot:COSAG01_NODE_42825_length_436_cov_0.706231_1_plen_23_part_01